MSTFFEKLTSATRLSTPEAIDVVGPQPRTKPQPPRPRPSEPHHLRVQTEESGEPQTKEAPLEEEGELTVDIYDRGDSLIIQSTVAGVKPEDLDVSISSDMVVIRGRREHQEEIAEDNYYYKELFWGNFSRSVILPEEIDDSASEANLRHGLLTIRLPKKKRGVTQRLKVKVT